MGIGLVDPVTAPLLSADAEIRLHYPRAIW